MIEPKSAGRAGRKLGAVLLAVALIAVAQPRTRAQVPDPGQPKYAETTSHMQDMREGKKNVLDAEGRKILPENRAIMGRMAKYLVYRVALPVYHEPDKGDPANEKTMTKLMEEAGRWLTYESGDRKLSPRQLEYSREFAKVMDEEIKFVLANAAKPIVRLNAVRMLAMVARCPYPGVVDTLLTVIKDPKESDGIKVYAFQGMRNLLNQADTVTGDHIINEPPKLAEIANALVKFITTPPATMPTDPREVDAINFVRREAIRALGAMRLSVVRMRTGEVLARPGLTLMRIAQQEKFTPPLSNYEIVEALLGFCHMRQDKEMRMDVAAYGINEAVLHLIRVQGDEKIRGANSMPWKVLGARLGAEATILKTNAQSMPNSTQPKPIIQVADSLIPVARELESAGVKANPAALALNDWKRNQEPAKPYVLFKDDKDSELWKQPAQ